jgi:cysteate synthase
MPSGEAKYGAVRNGFSYALKGNRLTAEHFASAIPGATGERHYTLVCNCCGKRYDDDGVMLDCSEGHGPSLLCTEYSDPAFRPRSDQFGLFRYERWLPVARTNEKAGGTVVYRGERLASVLGLKNLWVAFSGYWPERGALLETATFKELEAHTVLARRPDVVPPLSVASSGNTGAAFAWACSQVRLPCLVVIPGRGLARFRFPGPLDPCVRLVVIDDGDYPDAIELALSVTSLASLQAEGGIKNVGRRDGLAAVMLSAFEEMQCLPTHYFQAVGSGTGAIAVLEAAKRLSFAAGGLALPRLMLCQNLPFTPIYSAWRSGRRAVGAHPETQMREALRQIHADELTNWSPPYEIRGGVYDALTESKGNVLVADNNAVRDARQMFLELEGIDVEPAAGVAVACLREAVATREIDQDSVILLNVTGGGRLRLAADYGLVQAEPRLRLTMESVASSDAARRVAELCAWA